MIYPTDLKNLNKRKGPSEEACITLRRSKKKKKSYEVEGGVKVGVREEREWEHLWGENGKRDPEDQENE